LWRREHVHRTHKLYWLALPANCPLCPPKADMVQHDCDVRFVPIADITRIR
jgi:hypothetical protein